MQMWITCLWKACSDWQPWWSRPGWALIFQDLQVALGIHPSLFLGHWLSLQPPSEELLCCVKNTLEGTGECAGSVLSDPTCKYLLLWVLGGSWPVSEDDKCIEGQHGWLQVQNCLVWCCLSLSVNENWVPVTGLTFLFQIHLFYLEDVGYVWILILLEWWMKRGKSYSKVD